MEVKSNRLSQYKDLITDMVSYADIYSYLLEDDSVNFELNNSYLQRIKQDKKSNAVVISEVIGLLKKRKGGFDRFVEILRRTDYVWLAEQLDPECEYTDPQRKRSSIDTFVSSVARKSLSSFGRRKSRNTNSGVDDMVDSVVYTTYRDSYNSDISCESKRTSYGALSEKDGFPGARTSSNYDVDDATQFTKNDNISVDIDETLTQMSIDDPDFTYKRKSVVLYNVPESNSHFMDHILDTRQFEKVAKTLGLSSKILNGLKVIRLGRIGKAKAKGKNGKPTQASRPLKARFKTEEGCKLFLQSIKPNGGIINTEFGEVMVEPCDMNMSLTIPVTEKVKKKHWYQKTFFSRSNSSSSAS